MTILVSTPNGNVGRHIVAALRDRPDVRYLVRSAGSAAALGPVRGEVAIGDAADGADARRVAVGVTRLYLAHPFAEDQVRAEWTLASAALAAGASRIVKLGARAFTGPGIVPDAVTGAHDIVAARLREAGVPELTVLRPDRFLQNFLTSRHTIAGGSLPDPAGSGVRGFVDVRDIAEVAVAELTAERPVGGEIEVSGPRELHLREVAAAFAAAVGRPVRYLDVPLDERWRTRLVASGASEFIIDGLSGLYRNYRAERASGLGDGVRRVLGREPRSVDVFATEVLAPAR
ncbi:NmrA family NAD(P)-binding protein [Nocardia sp. NPDC046473]|uniref:NmrA family NAD(P)-binding protein n=1 Tax=Nocardia sp. NPDC046473 TaxID=3155733 RepID=UPI0033E74045